MIRLPLSSGLLLAGLALLISPPHGGTLSAQTDQAAVPHGIDTAGMDRSVKPGDECSGRRGGF